MVCIGQLAVATGPMDIYSYVLYIAEVTTAEERAPLQLDEMECLEVSSAVTWFVHH